MSSKIEWTDETWNPITGCSKVSPGCAYCYAERVSTRYGFTSLPWIPANVEANVVLHPERLQKPLTWKKPRKVFVNSMSDLFHEQVPDEFIHRVFAVMVIAREHTFQVLTKRPERMRAWFADRANSLEECLITASTPWPVAWPRDAQQAWVERVNAEGVWPLPNVWLGVSTENQHWADARIPLLLQTPASVRFVSAEPLLGHLDLVPYLDDRLGARLDWVIVGGESGGRLDRRLVRSSERDLGWIRSIRDQCEAFGVPWLFKQWGGPLPTSQGRELDERTWDEYPTTAREAASV